MKRAQCGSVLVQADVPVQVCMLPRGLHVMHYSVDHWFWYRPWWRRIFDHPLQLKNGDEHVE